MEEGEFTEAREDLAALGKIITRYLDKEDFISNPMWLRYTKRFNGSKTGGKPLPLSCMQCSISIP